MIALHRSPAAEAEHAQLEHQRRRSLHEVPDVVVEGLVQAGLLLLLLWLLLLLLLLLLVVVVVVVLLLLLLLVVVLLVLVSLCARAGHHNAKHRQR